MIIIDNAMIAMVMLDIKIKRNRHVRRQVDGWIVTCPAIKKHVRQGHSAS